MKTTRSTPIILAVLAAWLAPAPLPADNFIIHAGRVIDVEAGKVETEQSILIRDNKILGLRPGFVQPDKTDLANAKVIDLKQQTVMPGLIDMHTHLMFQHHERVYSDRFFMNEADFALRSVVYAERTLHAGFTSVRDLGDNGTNSVSLRTAIEKGFIDGPRIFTSGKSLASTGGHADPTNGTKGEFRRDAGPVEGVVNGVDDARKAVRQRYKDGADCIKLTATGGVLSLAANGQNPQFTMEELETIVAIAKDYGLHVAVHAHGSEGMKRAVLAGVDSIEHGTFMTPEIMELMKERGTYLVPTIVAGVWVGEKAKEDDYFPAVVRPKAAEIGPVIQDTFRKAYQAGVKIAFGTDSGVSPHGDNAREFELMVEAGMPPMEAIQAATMEAAKLLRKEDQLGSLKQGKLADLVAVGGNPLDDISVMKKVVFVMKDGKVYKHDNE